MTPPPIATDDTLLKVLTAQAEKNMRRDPSVAAAAKRPATKKPKAEATGAIETGASESATPTGPAPAPSGPPPAPVAPAAPTLEALSASNPAKPQPTGQPSFVGGNPQALEFDNPLEMLLYYRPNLKPYVWQKREMLRMAGYTNIHKGDLTTRQKPTSDNSLYYTLIAANGSGKDAYFIAPTAVWFCGSKIRSRCVITSNSDTQLKGQTFAYIKAYCETINAKHGVEIFSIVDKHIRCHRTGSEIVFFVTNTAGRAEGFHPYDDHPDGPAAAEFMFIANEAKSIDTPLWTGFDRYTGHNYWLEVSSPGERGGHFYESVQLAHHADHADPAKREHELGKYFRTKITAFDCPHISRKHLAMMLLRHGKNSIFWLTSVLAEFFEDSDQTVIPWSLTQYVPPAPCSYGLRPHAGLDLSLGGDETVLSIWRGNIRLAQLTCQLKLANDIRDWVIAKLAEYGVASEDCNADGGGLGMPIIHSLWEKNCNVRAIKNDERAYDSNNYRNRGSEMWFRFKRLVETQKLVLPLSDERFITQLTSRRYALSEGKTKLESKPDAKSRGAESPDRADAAVLAFATIPLSIFLGEDVGETDEEREFRENYGNRLDINAENFSKLERKLRETRDAQKPKTDGNHDYTAGKPIGALHHIYDIKLRNNPYAQN
jgi:hypothetical protein